MPVFQEREKEVLLAEEGGHGVEELRGAAAGALAKRGYTRGIVAIVGFSLLCGCVSLRLVVGRGPLPNTAHGGWGVFAEKKGACSAAGEDCTKTQCCGDAGMQCYEKDANWAECRAACTAGPDLYAADAGKWTCNELGSRTPGAVPNCSALGEDCSASKCCRDAGMQCYMKDKTYATCRLECYPGIDLTDAVPTPWSCTPLGKRAPDVAPWISQVCAPPGTSCIEKACCSNPEMQCYEQNPYYGECQRECPGGWACGTHGPRTPPPKLQPWQVQGKVADWVAEKCSKEGEDCRKSKCCTAPGNQCYEKNASWAVCKGGCNAGPDLYDSEPSDWTCKVLGPKTPGQSSGGPWKAGVAVSPWVAKKCAGEFSENCRKPKCCQKAGDQCYEKNEGWAACSPTCTPGPRESDNNASWSCRELGPRTFRPWGTPSLYCFSVVQPFGYEGPLVAEHAKANVGIFACDTFSVFSTQSMVIGDGPLGPVQTVTFVPAEVVQSKDYTAGNSELFIHVWDSVRTTGLYQETDWTIKVDPDAVLLPERLRVHLSKFTGQPAYIVNCAKPYMPEGPMMFGALEALSRQALETYYARIGECTGGLPWKTWGEDWFMGHCLDRLGVSKQNDFTIYSDGVCTGVDCGDPWAAAFHPKKDIGSWFACLEQTKTPHDPVTTDAPQWFKDYMNSYAR